MQPSSFVHAPVVLGIGLPGQENAMRAGSRDRVDRRLAAILAADVVGYSQLMEADERVRRECCATIEPLPLRSSPSMAGGSSRPSRAQFAALLGNRLDIDLAHPLSASRRSSRAGFRSIDPRLWHRYRRRRRGASQRG
jgi:hypothetical protein